jgi:FtsZ-interacting cell division protein ZipA
MEEARRWYSQRPRELVGRDDEFLAAVFALDRRGKRVRRVLLTLTFIVLGAVAIGALTAVVWIRGAEQDAMRHAAEAKSEKLAADAERDNAKHALEQRDKEEAQRHAAEALQKQTEDQKKKIEAENEQNKQNITDLQQRSKEQLEEDMKKLQIEKANAERNAIAAEKSAAEARKAKADADKLAQEKERALQQKLKETQDALSKLTTHLK